MIAIIGLVVGVVLGLFLTPDVPLSMEPYLPIAVVAGKDTIVVRADGEKLVFDSVTKNPIPPPPPTPELVGAGAEEKK